MANVSTNQSTPRNEFGAGSEPIPGTEREQFDDEDVGPPLLDEGHDEAPNSEQSLLEADARKEGWVPKEEWHSSKPWKPAEEFLDFKRKYIPAIKEETSKLQRELAELRRERDTEKQERAAAETRLARETMKLELRSAREANDWDRVDELTEKMFDLKIAEKAAPKPAQPTVDPEIQRSFTEFVNSNAWIKDDKFLARKFTQELKLIVDSKTADSMEEAMSDAAEEVRRRYPEKIKQTSAIGETGGEHSSSRPNGRMWSDLKPEFRRDWEEMLDGQGLSEAELKKSKARMLANSEPQHFRK
jgi:hypothetical protein